MSIIIAPVSKKPKLQKASTCINIGCDNVRTTGSSQCKLHAETSQKAKDAHNARKRQVYKLKQKPCDDLESKYVDLLRDYETLREAYMLLQSGQVHKQDDSSLPPIFTR
jgi:hypothetical protein